MATRSSISMLRQDGIYIGIYCNFDGYRQGVGAMLVQHYRTEEKILRLMELGHLSYLGAEIGEAHEFDNPHNYGTPAYDAWRLRHANWCRAYGRDRGEYHTQAIKDASLNGLMLSIKEAHNYLWRNGAWHHRTEGAKSWYPLLCSGA